MQLPPETPLLAPLPPNWPAPEALGFGQYLGPYLAEAQHTADGDWSPPSLTPRAAAPTPIASGAMQYALSVFEGLKAYRGADGSIHLFRPHAHAERLRRSARRLAMPEPPVELFLQLCQLAVQIHVDYVPPHGRGSLYLRPTLFAEEECLGLGTATRHRLSVVVTACSDPALKNLRLWAEPDLIRAAPGGLGATKAGANYAAGIGGLLRAKSQGYDDVAWLDACTHRELAEAGTMNLFVHIGSEVRTPPLDGTILAGVTRDTLIRLLIEDGIRVSEQAISLDELEQAQTAGTLGTAFGSGTAARLVRITQIANRAHDIRFPKSDLADHLYSRLKQIQEGADTGLAHWRQAVAPL